MSNMENTGSAITAMESAAIVKAAVVKAGKSIVITLPIAFKALRDYEAATPEGIKLINSDKEVKFVLSTGKSGSLSKYGIVFDSEDEKGNCQLTIATSDSPKTFAKKYSEAIAMLNGLANHTAGRMLVWENNIKALEEEITTIA